MNSIVLIDALAEMLSDWFRPVLSKVAVPVGTVAGDQLPFVFQLPLVDPVQVASWAWAGIAASKATAAAVVSKCVRIARSGTKSLPSLRPLPIRSRRQRYYGRAATIVSRVWLSCIIAYEFS